MREKWLETDAPWAFWLWRDDIQGALASSRMRQRALRVYGLAWIAIAAASLLLASCGGRLEVVPLPPNTAQACDKAIGCGAFLPEQKEPCMACLEHVDEALLDKLEADYGPIPPLDNVTCEQAHALAHTWTNLGICVLERWYSP